MNLSPSPKPVKVRITSGGIEHSSLDNLLNRFKWEDLEKNEEQVRRWLLRQGPKGRSIASQWKKGQKANNEAELFNIYDIFFNLRQQGISSINVLLDRWSKDKDGKTDNIKFILQSLLPLNYSKAITYIAKKPDDIGNYIFGGNNAINGIPSEEDRAFMARTLKKYLKYGESERTTTNLIHCFRDSRTRYVYDPNPDLVKIPPLQFILGEMQSNGCITANFDMELLIVYVIAYSFITRRDDEAGIVKDAMKVFGLSDLKGLKSRKDKIAAFFIALLRQRQYYYKMNYWKKEKYRKAKYSSGGIVQCYNYNYMAKLLYDEIPLYDEIKVAGNDSLHNAEEEILKKFPPKVQNFFKKNSADMIISTYGQMGTNELAKLWNIFCENIYILEIK